MSIALTYKPRDLITEACHRAGPSVAAALNNSAMWAELDFPFAGRLVLKDIPFLTSELRKYGYQGDDLGAFQGAFEGEGILYGLYDKGRVRR